MLSYTQKGADIKMTFKALPTIITTSLFYELPADLD